MSVRLFTGDCLQIMPTLPEASVDLILADPPYGRTQNRWDKVIPAEEMWKQIWRVCRGPVVLTAMQPFSSELVVSQLEHFKHEWVWEKNKATGHLNAKRAPMRAHEQVLVFCRGEPTYNPQMTDGHKPGNHAVRRKPTANYGAQRPTEYGGQTTRYPRSVQQFPVVNNDDPNRVHSTQKPVAMLEYFIRTYSNDGAAVLDFCMGSGSAGEACQWTGRNFIGIEADPAMADMARARLQTGLFAGAAPSTPPPFPPQRSGRG